MTTIFVPISGIESGIDYIPTPEPTETTREPDNGMHLYLAGGAAAADYDNDGWVDLYITRMDAPDLLYRNNGDGTFTDVAAAVGISRVEGSNGVTFADINNDGYQDIYVTTLDHESNYLYLSDGQGQFIEQASLVTGSQHFSFGAAFGDIDNDGDLDLHTTEWRNEETWNDGQLQNHTVLLENDGAGGFTDITVSAGVDIPDVYAFNSHFSDLDGDGYQDLIVTGDVRTSKLFWNNGDGTFTEGTVAAGVGTDKSGMGLTVGDANGDGLLDYFVTAVFNDDDGSTLDGNRLYINNGDRTFSDQTDAAGVRDGGWGWGTSLFDYDNDGDLDIAMTNGINPAEAPEVFKTDPTILWRNNGDGTFTDVTTELGISDIDSGRGLLNFDYDNDGDQDLLVINNGAEPVLYRNDGGNDNDWLKVDTVGTVSNADGVGAFITVIAEEGGPEQVWEVSGSNDFLGQSEMTAHFGLGTLDAEVVHLVRIEWLSGIAQEFRDVSKNTVFVAEEAPSYVAFLDSLNNLTITDSFETIDNNLTLAASPTEVTITDISNTLSTSISGAMGDGTNTVMVPTSTMLGDQIIVNSGGGNDFIKAVSLTTSVKLNGGDGNDRFMGSRSDDILMGDMGNDRLLSYLGDDILLGGEGNDFMRGGLGRDQLTGGEGVDTFHYQTLGDSLFPRFDTITDLEIGVDRIKGPNAVATGDVVQLGPINNASEAGIQAVLTAADFVANGAAIFTFSTGSRVRTLLALNDGVAGFSAADDAVLEITGFTGDLNNLAIV